jgi:hypothetical protein
MPFARKKIKVGTLIPATPTPFDAETLKTQLANIGLSCAQINDQNLNTYIENVVSEIPSGAMQSFAIKAPPSSPAVAAMMSARGAKARPAATPGVLSLAAAVPPLQDIATGNWTPSDDAQGYAPQLEVIQYPDHFNWLYDNRATNGFTGVKQTPPANPKDLSNADAIQKLFVEVCWSASSALIKGLDKNAMQALLTNVIQPLGNANLADYNQDDSRAVFLVDNYNPSTGEADSVGVLTIHWHLKIEDYKRKTKDGGDTHHTSLTVDACAVTYADAATLCADYNSILEHFGISKSTAPECKASYARPVEPAAPARHPPGVFHDRSGAMPFPPAKTQLKIFDTEPVPNQDTWNAAVKATSTAIQQLAVVLFSPNLQLIGSLDNSKSSASCDYQISVTRGFSFSATQGFAISEEIGVDIEVFTATISWELSLSFTEEWSESKTTTVTFSCPAGQKAFLYQGTLMSKLLSFDPATATFAWVGGATKVLTEIMVSSATPIGAAPLKSVTVRAKA